MREDFPSSGPSRSGPSSRGRRARACRGRRQRRLCGREGHQHGRPRRLAGNVARARPVRRHGRPRPLAAPGWVPSGAGWLASRASVSSCASRRAARTRVSALPATRPEAVVVGDIDASGQVALRQGPDRVTAIDLSTTASHRLAPRLTKMSAGATPCPHAHPSRPATHPGDRPPRRSRPPEDVGNSCDPERFRGRGAPPHARPAAEAEASTSMVAPARKVFVT